jgi:PPIC-type PPIASE domain
MNLRPLFLLCLLGTNSCVVSTYGGTGTPPDVPLPPEQPSTASASTQLKQGGPLEIGASHILISYKGAMRAAPYVDRTKAEARQFAEELRKQALAGEDFAKMAENNSDDRGSAAAGGSLGTFSREQMVPEFSNAAFDLEIGGVSEVVESPFGFHVILRQQ